MDTYLKRPNFSALNAKCYNSLSSFWIFHCILRVWVIKRTQKLHENSGDIFENVRIVCVECNKLDSLFDYRLGKKQNWQLDCHGWTVENFYVCIKSFLNYIQTSRPFILSVLTNIKILILKNTCPSLFFFPGPYGTLPSTVQKPKGP